MAAIAIPAKSHISWSSDLPEKLSEAVGRYSLPDQPEWSDLDELSSRTMYDGIDVFGEEAAVEGDHFVAPANVYVRLTYGSKGDESEMTDVYPSRVHFKISGRGKSIKIERIEIDTSSFYE